MAWVIKVGGSYLCSGIQTWSNKIERARRYTREAAEAVQLHITKGPPDPKGNYSPKWKWIQGHVIIGTIIGYREEITKTPVTNPDGSVTEKITKKMIRFEEDRRPLVELIEVPDDAENPFDLFIASMRS